MSNQSKDGMLCLVLFIFMGMVIIALVIDYICENGKEQEELTPIAYNIDNNGKTVTCIHFPKTNAFTCDFEGASK